ncbi:MAG: hypothetical protein Q7U04_13105 [Bacteriovorax sp.]|nr:hypothetical protein [Bacteriovorax sp.]
MKIKQFIAMSILFPFLSYGSTNQRNDSQLIINISSDEESLAAASIIENFTILNQLLSIKIKNNNLNQVIVNLECTNELVENLIAELQIGLGADFKVKKVFTENVIHGTQDGGRN